MNSSTGVALILSLIMLTLLIVIAYQFSFSVNVDKHLAGNLASYSRNYYAARGALALVKAYLKKDVSQNPIDTLKDCWATGEYLQSLEIGQAKLSVEVWDSERLLCLNNMRKTTERFYTRTRDSLKRLIEFLGIESGENATLYQRICDYIDEDKDGDFEENAANKPLFLIEDLLSINGVTKEYYKGWTDKFGKTHKGLYETTTEWGSGRININTAPKEVLVSISNSISETDADNIIAYREENDFATPQDLTKVEGLSDIFSRDKGLRDFLTTISTHFIARIKVESDGRILKVRAVLRRNQQGVTLLVWKEEEE
ncbi:MAG: type II secretion system minor pseudopilin GspK [Planctomycetota bacterium]|nr:type II secretion system minor pseudopilin GspK [Planctomycetota bacterium]